MKPLAICRIGRSARAHTRDPVARVQLNESINAAIAELQAAMPATEFTPALLDDLRRCLCARAPAWRMRSRRWLERVLGPRGLVVFDASDPAAKAAGRSQIFAREIEQAGRDLASGVRSWSRPRRPRISRAGHAARRQPRAVSHECGPRADQDHSRMDSRSATRRSRRPHCSNASRTNPAGVQPQRAAAADRAGHDLSNSLLRRGPKRAGLPRSASPRLRVIRRADAADPAARHRDHRRFQCDAVLLQARCRARDAARAGRSRPQ